MAEKNQDKKAGDKNDKIEQHKKSKAASKAKSKKVGSIKNGDKTGTEHDDRNDPTGNAHLAG
jgi:hypothetical protein